MTANSVYMNADRLAGQAEPLQRDVQEAPVAEQGHPAGGAHGVADEQRQHQQHDQEVLEPALRARQLVGEREAPARRQSAVTITATRSVR